MEKYVYSSVKTSEEIQDAEDSRSRFTHEVPREAKGKQVVTGVSRGLGGQDREKVARRVDHDRGQQEWRPRENASLTRPVSLAPGVLKELEVVSRSVSVAPRDPLMHSLEARPVSAAPEARKMLSRSVSGRETALTDPAKVLSVGLEPVELSKEMRELLGGSTPLHGTGVDGEVVGVVAMGLVEVVARQVGDVGVPGDMGNGEKTSGEGLEPSPEDQENRTSNPSLGPATTPLNEQIGLITTGPFSLQAGPENVDQDFVPSSQLDGPKNDQMGQVTIPQLSGLEIKNNANDVPLEEGVFCDPSHPPSQLIPPPNFDWVFLYGIWTLVPKKFTSDITARSNREGSLDQHENLEIWSS